MTLTYNAPTTPTLQAIATEEPILLREVGQRGEGLMWVVEPEDFDTVIDMVNTYGGPAAYRITPLSELTTEDMQLVEKARPDIVEHIHSF